MTRKQPQLRIALLLGLLGVLAQAALFPYLLAAKPGILAMASGAYGVPGAVIIALQSIQAGVICFLLAWAGLLVGRSLDLSAPWLGAWLYARPRPASSSWWLAALLGAAAGEATLAPLETLALNDSRGSRTDGTAFGYLHPRIACRASGNRMPSEHSPSSGSSRM